MMMPVADTVEPVALFTAATTAYIAAISSTTPMMMRKTGLRAITALKAAWAAVQTFVASATP